MSYVDGVIIPVPTANREQYENMAGTMAGMFKEYGALSAVECWENTVPEGKVTSMRLAVQLKEDESVVFSWVMWPSKDVRDQAWEKIMSDERMANHQSMPFDGKRMVFGGFDVMFQA
jgi:uncharacterized protein YbaA (DUF1428 family)